MPDPTRPIFISYRRTDAGGHARLLDYRLRARFGDGAIFFDRATIAGGEDFPERLQGGVEGCAVLLALIGPDWLTVTGDYGMRRLDMPNDVVRREIALALSLGRTVIPVLFDETEPPPAAGLPDDLKPLASRNMLRLRGNNTEFEAQFGELVRVLRNVLGVPEPRPEPDAVAAVVQRVPIPTLRAILAAFGEQAADLDPATIEQRLTAKAKEFTALQERLHRLTNDDPAVVGLRQNAAERLAAGDFAEADRALAEAEARDLAAVEELETAARQKRLSAGESRAERGAAARLRLAYREAAGHYAEAARIVAPANMGTRWKHTFEQAGALFSQGDEFADNGALSEAIDVYRQALALAPRDRRPDDWAMTQNNLGNALCRLGERESGTERLEEAVAAYRAALEVFTGARVPLHWATTQTNLGNAFQILGLRKGDKSWFGEAVEAYRRALKERTRERVPLDWAATLNNLGNALYRLGEVEGDTAILEEAARAFQAALKERTRDLVPLDWAHTQNNLGNVLWLLGELTDNPVRLEKAVTAYRAGLEERTRKRVPLDWAMSQHNLGNALRALGTRESGTKRLEEAVEAYRDALTERTRERVPLDWAMTQINLGIALSILGERESGPARLKEAVQAYRAALEECTRARMPLQWATTQSNLGIALAALGERTGDTARLEEAVAAYRAALTERTRERVPLDWATTQNNLGNALLRLGERESGPARLEEAVAAFRTALEVFAAAGAEYQVTLVKANLARAEALLAERGG
jgi:tetratricopeptide (TPR) repeat protein